MAEHMELERELADLEASDRELADKNPKRLLDFLLMIEENAWSNGFKRAEYYCMDPAVKFKVAGRRVYREIHKEGSCYREEHLDTPLNGIPIYRLKIRDNVEKVPSLL